MFRSIPHPNRLLSLALVLVMGLLAGVPAHAQEEDQRLEQLLGRLGLVELELRHLEKKVETSVAPERLNSARRLADLYASQLTEALDDAERYAALTERVERLIAAVPEAKTGSLEVTLLQTDYQRAETLIARAMLELNPAAVLGEAASILHRITPVLGQRQEELWRGVEKLRKEMEATNDDAVLDQLEKQLQREQIIAGRAAYFAGWSYYYRGLLATPVNLSDFATARGIFCRILEIAEEDQKANYAELDAEVLALQSIWRARTVIGLGLSEAGMKNVPASRTCFELLKSPMVPAPVRDEVDHWYLQALLNAGKTSDAISFARQRLADLKPPPTQGKVSFCSTLLRAGLRPWHGHPAAPELAELGKSGLVKLRQHRLLSELLTRYGGSLEEVEGFALRWLRGQKLRKEADESKAEADYRKAAEALREALADPQAQADVAGANRCRMELAWCLYQLGEDAEAARLYREAGIGLRAAKIDDAVNAGWMAFVANHRIATRTGTAGTALSETLAWLKREFPDHAHTKRAEFIAAKVNLKQASPEEQQATLAAVPPGDPNYVAARQQLSSLLYERWTKADTAAKSSLYREASETIQQVLGLSTIEADPVRQAPLRLMLLDMALSNDPPDRSAAKKQLDEIARRISAIQDAEQLGEYHYRRIQYARLVKNEAMEAEAAQWFVGSASSSRWELAGLIAAAKLVDEQHGRADGPRQSPLAEQGFAIYSRIVERLGDDVSVLTEKRNAEVAMSKRAHYAYLLGRLPEAAESLRRLLEARPREKGYLRRAGQVAYAQKDYAAALEYWRVVLAGSRAGAEEWYEAKYYQLACLLETDRALAAQVFKQFELLDPSLGSEAWRDRFRQIQEQL